MAMTHSTRRSAALRRVTAALALGALALVIGAFALCPAALAAKATRAAKASVTRAAYIYDYMPAAHIDELAQAGINRLLVHWIADSLDSAGTVQLKDMADHAVASGIDFVPEWLLQQKARLAVRPLSRRYTWGHGVVEVTAACPLDSAYWRSALLDRAEEWLAADPRIRHLAVDLELLGAGRHHYDGGPCSCSNCIAEYAHGRADILARDPAQLTGLLPYEEARIAAILRGLLAEFAARHPGVELGVLDLDLDSFVHRAFGRALARRKVPALDYTESSYGTGAPALAPARKRLDRLGLRTTPLIAGLWLKRWTPDQLTLALRKVNAQGDGYFVFTTYSLWQSPARLNGPYTLQGAPGEYWRALREANTTP